MRNNDFDINIAIFQNGKEIPVTEESNIDIKKEKFAIRFNNKRYNKNDDYSAKIAALKTRSELNRVRPGEITEDSLLFFFPGTDMAPFEDNFYQYLHFSDMAHTSLYYENERNRRVKLLSEKDNLLRLEFEIDKFELNEDPNNFNEPPIHISKINKDKIYIAVFIDKNLNGRIERGEYSKITIQFE